MPAPDKQAGLDCWLEYIQHQHARSIDLNLARVRRVWHSLGAPTVPFIILVAGTNGKGSSVAMLEAVLRYAGLTTGTYTSPHLLRFNERICINQQPAPDADIITSFQRIEIARGQIPLTYFEYATLAAMLILHSHRVDAAVLEVGLGGRLDATNIFTHQLALITSIGLDHQSWLGQDREAIGREKAGIIRYQGVSVCADIDPPASLLQTATNKKNHLFRINHDFSLDPNDYRWRCSATDLTEEWSVIELSKLPLYGAHQIRNAAGVIMALAATRGITGVEPCHIRDGLAQATIAGRQQIIATQPQIIVDVAHNCEAVEMLLETLDAHPVDGDTHIVFAVLTDKPVAQMVSLLATRAKRWYLASLDCERGLSSDQLEKIVRQIVPQSIISTHTSPVNAYKEAIDTVTIDDRVVIFGSFVTVGDIIGYCGQHSTTSS